MVLIHQNLSWIVAKSFLIRFIVSLYRVQGSFEASSCSFWRLNLVQYSLDIWQPTLHSIRSRWGDNWSSSGSAVKSQIRLLL